MTEGQAWGTEECDEAGTLGDGKDRADPASSFQAALWGLSS